MHLRPVLSTDPQVDLRGRQEGQAEWRGRRERLEEREGWTWPPLQKFCGRSRQPGRGRPKHGKEGSRNGVAVGEMDAPDDWHYLLWLWVNNNVTVWTTVQFVKSRLLNQHYFLVLSSGSTHQLEFLYMLYIFSFCVIGWFTLPAGRELFVCKQLSFRHCRDDIDPFFTNSAKYPILMMVMTGP